MKLAFFHGGVGPGLGSKGERVIQKSVVPSWDRLIWISMESVSIIVVSYLQLTEFYLVQQWLRHKTCLQPYPSIHWKLFFVCVGACMCGVWSSFVTFHWQCLSWQWWINTCLYLMTIFHGLPAFWVPLYLKQLLMPILTLPWSPFKWDQRYCGPHKESSFSVNLKTKFICWDELSVVNWGTRFYE